MTIATVLATTAITVAACGGQSSSTSSTTGTLDGTLRICTGPIGEPPPLRTAMLVITRDRTPGTSPLTIRANVTDGVAHVTRALPVGQYSARLMSGGTVIATKPVSIAAGDHTSVTLGPPKVCPLNQS